MVLQGKTLLSWIDVAESTPKPKGNPIGLIIKQKGRRREKQA